MAHIIQSMQKDLLALKEERLTEKLIMAIHDAKKVMQPWNFSDATPTLLNFWINNASGGIHNVSEIRNDSSHFVENSDDDVNMRMKFVIEKLQDPSVTESVKKRIFHRIKTGKRYTLTDTSMHPIDGIIGLFQYKFSDVTIDDQTRFRLEEEWKYL